MSDLYERFNTNKGRVIHKLDHYFPIYERHLSAYRNRPVTMIEIGCGLGGSLEMWRDWLGPASTIVGIDIRPECRDYAGGKIHVCIGDQRDPGFLASVLAQFPQPDIVLDDGSHFGQDQIASFDTLFPSVRVDGVYIVEDLHCSYEREFNGGHMAAGTFMEFLKTTLDAINRSPAPTNFARLTGSMHIYPSMAVFERGTAMVTKIGRRIPGP